jgi:excisionase family DNA binding protein
MWTATQVADLLNVRASQVYRLVQGRQIPFIRIGRQLRFDPSAIQEWLEARTTQVQASEER